MVVFVEEDVAASEMWQKTEDGKAEGLRFLLGNVIMLVIYFPKAACFESADGDHSPTVA
jgi:hypothetical protein